MYSDPVDGRTHRNRPGSVTYYRWRHGDVLVILTHSDRSLLYSPDNETTHYTRHTPMSSRRLSMFCADARSAHSSGTTHTHWPTESPAYVHSYRWELQRAGGRPALIHKHSWLLVRGEAWLVEEPSRRCAALFGRYWAARLLSVKQSAPLSACGRHNASQCPVPWGGARRPRGRGWQRLQRIRLSEHVDDVTAEPQRA